jgi:hypothetical protein
MKAILAPIMIAASPGISCAESWILWESYGQYTAERMSRPKSIGIHETKAACLVAARDNVESRYTSTRQ